MVFLLATSSIKIVRLILNFPVRYIISGFKKKYSKKNIHSLSYLAHIMWEVSGCSLGNTCLAHFYPAGFLKGSEGEREKLRANPQITA